MFWLLLALLLVCLGVVFYYIHKYWDGEWDMAAFICLVFGGIALAITLIAIPLCRNNILAQIEKHEAIRQTIIIAREQGEITGLERVRLIEDIIEANKALAYAKYYASHPWFKLYYPEEVLEVEPIN